MGALRTKVRHAFAVDPPGPVEPTASQQGPVDWFCRQVAKRRLATAGMVALELARPLNFLFSQGMHLFSPAVWAIARRQRHEDYKHFAAFLEKRGSIDYIVRRIEELEDEFTRKRGRRVTDAEPPADGGGPEPRGGP